MVAGCPDGLPGYYHQPHAIAQHQEPVGPSDQHVRAEFAVAPRQHDGHARDKHQEADPGQGGHPQERSPRRRPTLVASQTQADERGGDREAGDTEKRPQTVEVTVGGQLTPACRYRVAGKDGGDGHAAGADQEQGQADSTTRGPYLRLDGRDQRDAAGCQGEKGHYHHPAVAPDLVLADHAPRGIQPRFEVVQSDKQDQERSGCRQRQACRCWWDLLRRPGCIFGHRALLYRTLVAVEAYPPPPGYTHSPDRVSPPKLPS